MIEIRNEQLFHLYNEKISYIINVLPNQQLGHVYFGPSLGTLAPFDQAYLEKKENKSAGTVKFLKQTIFLPWRTVFKNCQRMGLLIFEKGQCRFLRKKPLFMWILNLWLFTVLRAKNESWRNQPALLLLMKAKASSLN